MNPTLPSPEYEPTEGSPRAVVISAGGLVLGVALVLVASAALYVSRPRGPHSLPPAAEFSFTHGPTARTDIARDREAQDALSRERLHGYGWIDRDLGTVRIPIDQAMELIADEAMPNGGRQP